MKRFTVVFLSALCFVSFRSTAALSSNSFPENPADDRFQYSCADLDTWKTVLCSDSIEMDNAVKWRVASLVERRNFTKLEELYNRYQNTDDRFLDGRWKLTKFEEGLEDAFRNSENTQRILDDLHTWQEKRKDAVLPKLAKAYFLFGSAWRALSSAPNGKVSQNAQNIFATNMQAAWKEVQQLEGNAKTHPLWHNLRIRAAVALGAETAMVRTFFNESRSIYPEFHQLYFSMATALEPRFGGNLKEFEQFARDMQKATAQFEGEGMYGRIYWNSDHGGGAYFAPGKSLVKWEALKKSHADLLKKHPKSDHNRGYFASLACRAGDVEQYKALRETFLVRAEDIQISWPGLAVCDKASKRPVRRQ